MQLIYKGTVYKIACVLRYWVAKLFHAGRFSGNWLSMIGRRCGVYVDRGARLECRGRLVLNDDTMLQVRGGGRLSIGERFTMNSYSRIVAHERISIGDRVTIGRMVSILDHDHHLSFSDGKMELSGYDTESIEIGNDVWIADKVTILKGVRIGNNVVLAANSVVNKSIPDNTLAGGIPARTLKSLV